MGDAYTPTANYRLACVAESAMERITDSSRTSRHVPLVPIASFQRCARYFRFTPTGGTAASAGAHAFGLDHCDGRLRHQIGHKRLGRFWFFAVRGDTCCVDDLPLYFGREWANHVQAGIVQHVKEEYGELGVAVGNRLDDLRGRWLRLGLGFHLLGNAKTLVYGGKLGTGGARRYRGDRLRLEQRLLESLRRANVGFRRTRADRDADTYIRDASIE